MKQLFVLLFTIILTSNLLAKEVSIDHAKKVASNFLTSQTTKLKSTKIVDLNDVGDIFDKNSNNLKSSSETNRDIFLFNNGNNNGFVIVAGDDASTPILGYSLSGSINTDSIPPNFLKWVDNYKKQIQFIKKYNIKQTEAIKELWSNEYPILKSVQESVAPLINTKWGQGSPYNEYCPKALLLNRTLTGCVATAMAQIMKYWNYPEQGQGFHSYNCDFYGTQSANFGATTYQWSSMPVPSTTSSNNAVATLMYHCGVSVNMDYGYEGSAASSHGEAPSAISALKTYFGYKNTLQTIVHEDYTDPQWLSMLKTELDMSRPILFTGRGSGGHAFICDGYNNSDYFHFNWGWDGNSDGYFLMNSLNPGSYTYNTAQKAIIGIEPDSETAPQNYDLRLYSSLTMSSKIRFTNAIILTTNIVNYGTDTFSGKLGAAVFDSEGNFIDYIEMKSDISLSANSYYTNGLTFSNTGSAKFVPGTYYVSLFYKTTTNDWAIIANGNYSNYKQFEIYYSSNIETNSSFNITTNDGALIQGQPATVNVDITNTGTNTFYGKLRVNLANLDGTWAQNIQVLNENNGLSPNYHYINGNNFSGEITVEPGTYLMEVAYQRDNESSWYYAGSTNYSNPVFVIVVAPPIQKDIYEQNDDIEQAYNFDVNIGENHNYITTLGSNFHLENDLDYYKLTLSEGFNYSIIPRLHDSFNSGNEESYSVDALFSYSVNKTNIWSDTFDDIMPNSITVEDGGTLYFKVAPYFTGSTGTYQLDISIERTIQVLSPVANFEADLQSGEASLNVQFTDLSSNNPTSWIWSFEGGTPTFSNQQNPTVTYNTEGTYQVTLTCSNSAGENTITKSSYITVSPKTNVINVSDNSISFYPNPTSGNLYINTDKNFEIRLFSTSGMLLLKSTNKKFIDLTNIDNGLYFLEIRTKDGTKTGKILKQ